ncbi:MAG: hydroxyacid dehydrogenase [Ramlibacter sp.]|nr:hydroxyacid dehydrogenase [Ramlibacter sp.]
MDILLLDAMVPEAVAWLESRHQVATRPELAEDSRALRSAMYKVRGVVLPRKLVITQEFLDFSPKLKVVARMHAGTDNTDLEACRERGVKVIQALTANVRSNAEYLLGALLMLYRRGMFDALAGQRHASVHLGRELYGSVVGILGLGPTAHALAQMLAQLGVRLIGYDPAVHHTAPVWDKLRIQPVGLADLMAQSDAVSAQIMYASRYRHFINAKVLAACKPGQVWVGSSRSALFEPEGLAAALKDGRISACLLDGAEQGFASKESPLHDCDNLFITPRLGSHTLEARLRASWYVAHRLHEAISARAPGEGGFSAPMDLELPSPGSPSQWGEPEFIIR